MGGVRAANSGLGESPSSRHSLRVMRSLLAATTAITLLVSLPVAAAPDPAPTTDVPAEADPEPDPTAAAKKAHAAGQNAFDIADYDGAIIHWTAALDALPPDDPKAASIRSYILYNVAAAREKMFDIHGDVAQLKAARILLQRFDESIDGLYGDDPETAASERARVREKLASLEARIAEAEGKSDPVTPPDPRPVEPRGDKQPDEAPPTTNAGRGMLIGGGVLLGLGVGAIAGLGATLSIGEKANDISGLDDDDFEGREAQYQRGAQANAAAVAMGVLAPLLIGGGIAMVLIGVKQRRTAKAALSFGPRGFAITGRF